MVKTPCEYLIWDLLPIIRKELVCCIVHNFGLSQKEAAEKMGLTPATISHYKCHKRGIPSINEKNILKEIDFSAALIVQKGKTVVGSEICRICRLIQFKGLQIIE
jgi:predicted transcriptional regulator